MRDGVHDSRSGHNKPLKGLKMTKDVFGFSEAVQIDHLTNEQVEMILAMFDKENK
jgi:hypothetical protein